MQHSLNDPKRISNKTIDQKFSSLDQLDRYPYNCGWDEDRKSAEKPKENRCEPMRKPKKKPKWYIKRL